MAVAAVSEAFRNLLIIIGDFLSQFPILREIVSYIRRSYQNDPIRVVIEVLFFIFVLDYALKRNKKKGEVRLTDAVSCHFYLALIPYIRRKWTC